MSNTPTEAHRKLASKILWECPGVNGISQLIADSEAAAIVAAHSVTAVYAERDQLRARAERAEAELATERARLDWLMAGGVCVMQAPGGFYISRLHAHVSRAAIDAAMKADAK
jgi:hypothetical protein